MGRSHIRMAPVFVFAGALAFYVFTLAPTVIWGDSAWLSLHAYWGDFHVGTAGDHPLFLQIGHLATWFPGEVARNVNFVSSLFGALTVMLVYECARRLGAGVLASATGAGALCVSHAFWLHSVMAEVYTANAFFLIATLNLLIAWHASRRALWLAGAVVVFLIGLTNHLVLATAAPAALVFVLWTVRKTLSTRRVLLWTAALLVTLSVVASIFWDDVSATLWRLWVGPPGISEYVSLRIDPAPAAREGLYYVAFLAYQFPTVTAALGFLGAAGLLRHRRSVGGLLLLVAAVNASVFIRHSTWSSGSSSKYVFYIADYVVFSVLAAVGAQLLIDWASRRWSPAWGRRLAAAMVTLAIAVPLGLYAAIPAVSTRMGIDLVGGRRLAYRDNATYFLNPNKRGETGARRFGIEALDAVAPGGVLLADFTPCAVLRYLQIVEGRRRDVRICGEMENGRMSVRWPIQEGHRRPLYVAGADHSYFNFSTLGSAYELVPVGPIFEVRPR